MSNIFMHPTNQFTSSAKAPLGSKVVDGLGKTWRYVYFEDAITYAAKQPCTWSVKDTWYVTNDISETGDADDLAGVVNGIATENSYGYLQTGGRCDDVLKAAGDDSIAIGTMLRAHASTNAVLASEAITASTAGAPTNAELTAAFREAGKGYAIAAEASNDTSDTVTVDLHCDPC